ncbi:multiple C2 and transmembrane domain-containing protein-like [Cydia splendana]|uniref:multiple C2 and transmembrane domain-containing protein-like n=1 Tax=Cydia splendana TaxID=1100963 RepID=UPI0028F4B261
MDQEVSAIPNGGLGHRLSDVTSQDSDSGIVYRNTHRPFSMWRPSTFLNAVAPKRTIRNRSASSVGSVSNYGKDSSSSGDYAREFGKKRRWNTLVTVTVVQAKALPKTSDKSSVYCKIRLGTEIHKTKSVARSQQPEWKERFQLHIYRDHLLKVSLWDKDKQKNFMGSCVVDLTTLDKERTHELRLELDDGFGEIHLCVTMCTVRDDPLTTEAMDSGVSLKNKSNDLKLVGQLHVTAVAARGLSSKPNAYCTLELHNQRVQTHSIHSSSEPVWNKRYTFDVYDITSTLDVKIKDSSLKSSFGIEHLGKVSIPLFRITNGELRWFALKDKNKRNSAKGNHPRVLLQMSIVWSPIKAALKLFSPKEVKYIEKPRKLDIDVVYKNVIFIQDVFDFLHIVDDAYKRFLEWDNQELSLLALVGWLVFWFYFRPWTIPLLLLAPFVLQIIVGRTSDDKVLVTSYREYGDESLLNTTERHDKSLPGKIKTLPEVSIKIIDNIELVVSFAERIYNLATFKVPFLSYVTMVLLCGASFAVYFISINYMMMVFGTYKFFRKHLNPSRKPNNDLIDFISRIPDNEIWKDWKELGVPEPMRRCSERSSEQNKLVRSVSGPGPTTELGPL